MENKLISMVDFVSKLESKIKNAQENNASFNDLLVLRRDCFESIFKYKNFLKQPLELWMFVPCDENGDVLEVVPYYSDGIEKVNEYKKAKERCLFGGFKSVPFSNSVRKGNYIIDFNYTENINIESLLHHYIVFELTPTALKHRL